MAMTMPIQQPKSTMAAAFVLCILAVASTTVSALEGAYPSLAYARGNTLCSGTLVQSDMILTSAKCKGVFLEHGVYIGGTSLLGDDAKEYIDVADEWIHPKYDGSNEADSVMLVKLASVSNSRIQKLNTNPNLPLDHAQLTELFFGRDAERGVAVADLQEVSVEKIEHNGCAEKYDTHNGIFIVESKMFCTLSHEVHCKGDVGAPIYDAQGQQVGIVSSRQECQNSTSNFPDAAIRISAFYDWIHESICCHDSEVEYSDYCHAGSCPSPSPTEEAAPLDLATGTEAPGDDTEAPAKTVETEAPVVATETPDTIVETKAPAIATEAPANIKATEVPNKNHPFIATNPFTSTIVQQESSATKIEQASSTTTVEQDSSATAPPSSVVDEDVDATAAPMDANAAAVPPDTTNTTDEETDEEEIHTTTAPAALAKDAGENSDVDVTAVPSALPDATEDDDADGDHGDATTSPTMLADATATPTTLADATASPTTLADATATPTILAGTTEDEQDGTSTADVNTENESDGDDVTMVDQDEGAVDNSDGMDALMNIISKAGASSGEQEEEQPSEDSTDGSDTSSGEQEEEQPSEDPTKGLDTSSGEQEEEQPPENPTDGSDTSSGEQDEVQPPEDPTDGTGSNSDGMDKLMDILSKADTSSEEQVEEKPREDPTHGEVSPQPTDPFQALFDNTATSADEGGSQAASSETDASTSETTDEEQTVEEDGNGDDEADSDTGDIDSTGSPTFVPSTQPSLSPSLSPSGGPSLLPSVAPSTIPSLNPSSVPSISPSQNPTEAPSASPSNGNHGGLRGAAPPKETEPENSSHHKSVASDIMGLLFGKGDKETKPTTPPAVDVDDMDSSSYNGAKISPDDLPPAADIEGTPMIIPSADVSNSEATAAPADIEGTPIIIPSADDSSSGAAAATDPPSSPESTDSTHDDGEHHSMMGSILSTLLGSDKKAKPADDASHSGSNSDEDEATDSVILDDNASRTFPPDVGLGTTGTSDTDYIEAEPKSKEETEAPIKNEEENEEPTDDIEETIAPSVEGSISDMYDDEEDEEDEDDEDDKDDDDDGILASLGVDDVDVKGMFGKLKDKLKSDCPSTDSCELFGANGIKYHKNTFAGCFTVCDITKTLHVVTMKCGECEDDGDD